jgi:hypothetical protein
MKTVRMVTRRKYDNREGARMRQLKVYEDMSAWTDLKILSTVFRLLSSCHFVFGI